MKNYTKLEQWDNGPYQIYFSDNFYDLFTPYYKPCGSYFNVMYRLFGLLPHEFFQWCAREFNAIVEPNPYIKSHIRMCFKNKNDANRLCKEINTRINYYVEQGRF